MVSRGCAGFRPSDTSVQSLLFAKPPYRYCEKEQSMTTRGLIALVLLTTACTSTTVADYSGVEIGGTAAAGASSSAPAAKAMGAVSATASGGAAQAAGGSETDAPSSTAATSVGGSSNQASSTLVLPSLGGAQSRFSFPEQLPASGGSEAAGGTEASGGSSARMAALPLVAGAAGSFVSGGSAGVAGLAGAAGLPQYYSTIDNQVHPITDSPASAWDYDRYIGITCGSLISRPHDLCEPIDSSLPVADWKWRAKRVPGNPLITACLAAGDAACGKLNMAKVCWPDVHEDGTCGPTPHFEPQCEANEQRLDVTCLRICLACTDIPGAARPPSTCSAAQSAITVGMPGATCPTY